MHGSDLGVNKSRGFCILIMVPQTPAFCVRLGISGKCLNNSLPVSLLNNAQVSLNISLGLALIAFG